MSRRAVVILGAVAALLVVFILIADYLKWGEETTDVLINIDGEVVDSLRIEYADTSVLAVRGESGWNIAVPVQDVAADPVIKDMISAMESISARRSFVPDTSLARFGFSPAQIELSLKDHSGWVELFMGDTTPNGEFRYIRRGNDALVYLIPAAAGERMMIRFNDIRSKELLTMARMDLRRIQWTEGDEHMTVERSGNTWRITDPIRCRADGDRIDDFLRACSRPLVADFIPREGVFSQNQDDGSRLIFTGIKDTEGETLWIRTVTPQSLVRKSGRPHIMVLRRNAKIAVPKKVNDWRDRRLLPFYYHQVTRIEISDRANERLRFRRLESGWFANGIKVATDRISAFIRAMEDCSIDSFLPESEAPDPALTLTVRVWSNVGDSVEIGFGPGRGSSPVLSVSDLTPAALATCIDPDSVSTDIEVWRDRTLLTIFEYDVESVEFRTEDRVTRAHRLDSGEWKTSENWPPGAEPSECLEALNEARILKISDEFPESAQYRSEGTMRITFAEESPYLIHLFLGRDGVLYAAMDNEPTVALNTRDGNALIRLMNEFGDG